MPFSAGVFTRLYNWVTENASSPIEIAKLDTQEEDFKTAFDNCLLRDGTGVPTAATSWNSQRITTLGTPTSSADAARARDGFFTEASIASAGTTDLGTATSHLITVSGTTTITSFGSSASTTFPIYLVKFEGALTLTYNATSLITPSGANITTAANEWALVKYLGSGNWRVIKYNGNETTGSFTGTLVGCTTSPTATCYYSITNSTVTLWVNNLSGISNTTVMRMTGLPAAITPARTQYVAIPDGRTQDNSTTVLVSGGHGTSGIVDTDSILYMLKNGGTTGWTSSGTKGMGPFCVTYLLI